MAKKKTVTDSGISETLAAANKKTDGFVNIFTREGVAGADKATGFSFVKEVRLDEETVRQIYRSSGFGRKSVNRPVSDMTREWFDVIGDTDGEMNIELSRINAKLQTKIALTWAKVFGGSTMLMGIDDGGGWEDPLDEDNIKEVEFLQVYDRYRITWETADLYEETDNPKFGTPEWYKVTPIQSNTVAFKVHETRVLRFDGPLTDEKSFKENNSWNESAYQGTTKQLINLDSSYAAVKNVIDDFIQIIIKVEGLQQMVAAGEDDLIKTRLNIIDLGRHMMNTIMLDSKEEYTKESSSVAGLDKLLNQFQIAYSAVTDIPLTIMFGTSPKGMDATGDSDIQIYYDQIADAQEVEMLNPMERLVKLLMLQKEGPTNGVELENWAIDFNSLWQPTEKETVETRKAQAETDKMYIDSGVLKADEVAISRFGGDRYSIETEIDETMHSESELLNPDGSVKTDPEEQKQQQQLFEEKEDAAYTPTRRKKRRGRTLKINNRTKRKRKADGPFDTLIEDTTGEENDHTHEYFIFNIESGLGWTTSAGLDDHAHSIEGGTVQPFEGKDGTTHMHTLPRVK